MSEDLPIRFEFTQAEIDSRFIDHWEFCEDFVEGMISDKEAKDKNIEVLISPHRLFLAIDSTYQDIARYKNYHQKAPETQSLDCTKRCAFFMKWFPRFKPIFINRLDTKVETKEIKKSDKLELLNEFLAIYLFELHISDEIDSDIALTDEKLKQFAYDILYRNISKDGWISIMQLIKDCCTPKFIDGVPFLEKL